MAKLQTWTWMAKLWAEITRSKTEPVKEQQAQRNGGQADLIGGRRPKGKDSTSQIVRLQRGQAIRGRMFRLWHTVTTIRRNCELATRAYLSAFGVDDEASAVVVLNHM